MTIEAVEEYKQISTELKSQKIWTYNRFVTYDLPMGKLTHMWAN